MSKRKQDNNNMNLDNCQQIIFKKLNQKKKENEKIIDFLRKEHQYKKAYNVENCATYIGITSENGIAKIVKADFCKERICSVCAWRRQSKFVAQMKPILNILDDSYRFIFITLTIKNMKYEDLKQALNTLLKGFDLLRQRRKIKRSWKGMCRSLELTYNDKTNTFHPHIHILAAVDKDYFSNKEKYITELELSEFWKECIDSEYSPIVNIKAVEDNKSATIETIKYALKPSKSENALKAFTYILSGRRLISFTGVFAKTRKQLKLSNIDTNLLDDLKKENKKQIFDLWKFDATGGVYKFYKSYEIER